MNTRAKWAYLSYDSMMEKIADGTLDEYDVIYCTTTKENYVISPDLVPWAVRSKIYTFDSINEANTILNTNTDTYVGQIVAILKNDKYNGYIVNKNINEIFEVSPLANDEIDYNTIGNRPIENLIGSLNNRIIVSQLPTGTYKIKGQYKISVNDVTEYMSADGDLLLVEENGAEIYIKRFTKDTIYDFVVTDTNVIKKEYITDKYLADNGYTTEGYVDNAVAALQAAITADIETYVESIVTNKVDTIIDERLTTKLNGLIVEITNDEVQNLF